MSRWNDILLNVYFRAILEALAFCPPRSAFRLMAPTAHLFRDWETYSAWYEPGMFKNALRNLKTAEILPDSGLRSALKEYLRFESRYVLENIWIRKQERQHILSSFGKKDVARLARCLQRGPCLIATAHTSAIYLLVALADALGYKSGFVCSNPLRQPWAAANPVQRSAIRTLRRWMRIQPLLFVEDGRVVERVRACIRSGQSVIIPQDVLGYSERGVKALLFGRQVWSPVGAAKLAFELGAPLFVVLAGACHPADPYELFMKRIHPTGGIIQDVQCVFDHIEAFIKMYPACWGGWLYLDRMAVGSV